MRFVDPGVDPTSIHYFDEPSEFALRHLYYIQSIGRFDVNSSYKVNRFNYNSFLLIIMTNGTLCCHLDEQKVIAPAGAVILMDCHKPHAYYSVQPASFYFAHFGGADVETIYGLIHEQSGLMIETGDSDKLISIIENMLATKEQGKKLNEPAVSADLYGILMTLLGASTAGRYGFESKDLVDKATNYVMTHIGDNLTVPALAEQFGYSAGYFTSVFKRHTGFSPYQFILNCRLAHSQHLLSTTSLPVQVVADQSGFPNLANFSAAFRRAFSVTPSAYRKNPV